VRRALGLRELLPRRRVPGCQFAILNSSAGGAAVAQDDQVRIACTGSSRLLQSDLERSLHIGAAAQALERTKSIAC